mgnify:CR=1 FL=1
MGKGKFIVVEGIDASGKGTIAMLMVGYLSEKIPREKIVVTFEPTQGKYGTEIRKILKEEKDPKKNAERCLRLYVKDREEHVKNVILPALKEGKIVICDRYKYSTIAYQSAQGVPMKKIIKMHEGMPVPDLTIILDISPEVAIKRIIEDKNRKEFDKFEKMEFLALVREKFLLMPELFPNENIKIVDATAPAEITFSKIVKEIDKVVFG